MLVTGRPYAIGGVLGRLAAVVQAFFPGEEGGRAIARVLTGRVTPSGKLPVVVRSRTTGGFDDLVVLNGSQQQRTLISHSLVSPRGFSGAAEVRHQ